jgi:membrane fusion protein, copper/silver efflux system
MKTVIIFIWIFAFLGACDKTQNERTMSNISDDATSEHPVKYTCPMHPQVVQSSSGNCPICKMQLVAATRGNDLMLTDRQMRLANITTGIVSRKSVSQAIAINGRIEVNEQRVESITCRASGRIEKLYIKETGKPVRIGEPLYVLYSERLLILQQEYLLAKDQYEGVGKAEIRSRYRSFLDAAQRKLLLYGLTKRQIEKLTRESIAPRITFVSPASGIVNEISATEGQYVEEGAALYEVADLTSVWVEAELYPGESSLIKVGDEISVDGPHDTFLKTHVNFLSPEYRSKTQILVMRADLKNESLNFKPGQQVQVFLTPAAHDAIAIPANAVIRDGRGAHVYVQSAHNTFQPRMVKTGMEGFGQVEIIEGLQEGDTVAVSGSYLLYSELTLKGTDPMAGHSH